MKEKKCMAGNVVQREILRLANKVFNAAVLSLVIYFAARNAQAANIIVDGTCDGTVGVVTSYVYPGTDPASGGIDDGWWTSGGVFAISGGTLNRAAVTKFSERGAGQLVTSTAVTGQTVTLSFDQSLVDANGDSGYGVIVYGYDHKAGHGTNWIKAGTLANSDCLTVGVVSHSDNTGGTGNYDMYVLSDNLIGTTTSTPVSFDIVLNRTYEYFGVVFYGKMNTGDSWSIDNVSLDIQVNSQDQTISFSNPGDQITTNTVVLSAIADSGLPVSFGVVSGPASLNGSNVTFTGSGSVILSADQSGDSSWNAAPQTNVTFNVTKASATVTLSNMNQPYDGSAKSVTVTTVPSGLTVDVTYNGSASAPSAIGTYAVTGTVNEVMYQGSATGTLTIYASGTLGTNELAVDINSAVSGPGTNWATAFQTISEAVASSDFDATKRNIIVIKGGVYRENIVINKSGTAGAPLVLMQATTNDRVVISGMKALTNWTFVSGNIYRNEQIPTSEYISSLRVNGKRMQQACMPNGGGWWRDTSSSSVGSSGSVYTVTLSDTNHLTGLTNDLSGASVLIWNLANNIFGTIPIDSFNSTLGQVTFHGGGTWLSNVTAGIYFSLFNQKSLMDLPGEWVVVTNGGTNVVYLSSPSGTPSDVEVSCVPGPLVSFSGTRSHIIFSGLEVVGAAAYWNANHQAYWNTHNMELENGSDIGVYNTVSYGASGNGIWLRSITDGEVANCILRENEEGLTVYACTDVTVQNNDIGYNSEDSLRFYNANKDCSAYSNYIHHTAFWGHSDGMQIAGTGGTIASNITVEGNLLLGDGQSFMTETTSGDIYENNMAVGCEAYVLICGGTHNDVIFKNTLAFSRYGSLNPSGSGYDVSANIFCTGNSSKFYTIASCTGYVGDYNWFYPAPRESGQNILGALVNGQKTFFKTLPAFQSATGQDMNSSVGDPGFINAPVGIVGIDRDKLNQQTANTLVLEGAPQVVVGDHVEYNCDGVCRTVTNMPNSITIQITPALDAAPNGDHMLLVWGTETNLVMDLRATNTLNGSTIYIPAYQNGDFDNDGIRDLPPLPVGL